MHQLSATQREILRPAKDLDERLTTAERKIIACAMTIEAQTTKQIAVRVGGKPSTVETHIKNVRIKASEVYHMPVTFAFVVSELKRYYFVREGEFEE